MAEGFFPAEPVSESLTDTQRLERKIDAIFDQIQALNQGVQKMGLDFTQINAGIAAIQTAVDTAVTDLKALQAQVAQLAATQQNPADQQTLNDIGTKLGTIAGNLNAAEPAPAAPPATPTP